MPLDCRKTRKNLKKKGFVENRRADHIQLIYSYTNESTDIQTKFSHGSKHKELSDALVSSMATQCRIFNSNFVKLAKCEISATNYMKLIKHHLPLCE